MTIAVPECSSETWRRNSTPSMPGMSRSQTTMSGRGSAPSSASAPSPSAASSSSPAPRLARICSVVRRWNSWSSTTITVQSASVTSALLSRTGQAATHEPQLAAARDGLLARPDAELRVERAGVGLDRVARDVQRVGDLAQAAGSGQAAQHLDLATRQLARAVAGRARTARTTPAGRRGRRPLDRLQRAAEDTRVARAGDPREPGPRRRARVLAATDGRVRTPELEQQRRDYER